MTATATVPASDETFGGYRILEVIGTGGMSVVYRAEQISLGREVALKVMAPSLVDDAEFRERFRREGRHVAALEHPNIVTVHDCGEVDGRLYLAMRLVRGVTLAQVMRDGGLNAEETVRLLTPIAGALDVAATANVVHRDVKPQNILVDQDGRPYLADFGVAKAGTTIGSSATGGFVGTYNYAAPEQILGRPVTPAADIYALTAVLFECLTGARPYARDAEPAVLHAHVNEPPPTVARGQPGADRCDRLIARGMAKRPASRFASAGEMMSEAAALVASLPASRRKAAPPFTPAEHPPRAGDTSPGTATGPGSAVPGEAGRVDRAGSRARWVVAGLLAAALVLALAVVALTNGGSASVHRRSSFTASLPPFVARYSRPWRQAAHGTLGAGDATLAAVDFTRPASVPGDVPPALARSYGHPLASADAEVAGHAGRRYEWSPLGESVVAYVLATAGGESALVCRAPTSATAALRSCALLARRASLPGGGVIAPGPDRQLARAIGVALEPVLTKRRSLHGLDQTTLSTRASVAKKLEKAELAAAGRLSRLSHPALYQPVVRTLTGALRAEAGALTALAHAGTVDNTSTYATDIGKVTAASRKLSAAPGRLGRFELALPSFEPLHLAAPPQTFQTSVGGTGGGTTSSVPTGSNQSNVSSAPVVSNPLSNKK